jgi:hypothetical protein
MQHGLAVALFMATAALCGTWLSVSGRARPLFGLPTGLFSAVLFVVTAMCRSSYALILLVSGVSALLVSRATRTRAVLVVLLAIAPSYMALRTVGGWDGQILRQTADAINEDRSESLGVRLASEDACWRWVQGSLLFGKGRFDGMQASLSKEDRFIPDGLWLIALAKYGLFGLAAVYGVLLFPAVSYLWGAPPDRQFGTARAGATVLAVVMILYALDNLLNAMVNPLYLLAAGGIPAVLDQAAPRAGAPMAWGPGR